MADEVVVSGSTIDVIDEDFCFSKELSLEKIRQMMGKFVKDRDWDQFHSPRNLLLALVGEVGELAEIFQWKGEVKSGLPDWSEKEREHLGQELSDVLFNLIMLSNKCQIDLPTAAMKKYELNIKKYPANVVSGSCKKYTEYKEVNGKLCSDEKPSVAEK